MANTTIKTRILLRNDTLANWTNSNLVLAKGEVAIATVGENLAEVRVGTGSSTWASSLKLNIDASQVSGIVDLVRGTSKQYKVVANGESGNSWKLQEAALSGGSWIDVADSGWSVDFSKINGAIDNLTADVDFLSAQLSTTQNTLRAVSSDYFKAGDFNAISTTIGLDAASSTNKVATLSDIANLAGAMHFRGAVTPNESETDYEALARAIVDPASGDVAIITSTSKEYVYSGTTWIELGDEVLYATKAEVNAYALKTEAAEMSAYAYSEASTYTDNVIKGLDVASTEGGNENAGFVTLVTEVDGKVAVTKKTIKLSDITDVTDISTNIGLSNYALSADVTTLIGDTHDGLVGKNTDVSSANTIYGAKAYTDGKVSELSNGFLILDCGGSSLRSSEPIAGDLTV